MATTTTTATTDDSSLLPVRHADFVIDLHDSPASLPLTLSLPCVGFDFGSHFLRSAVVRRVELERKEAVVISVATFVATSEATRVALADAKKLLAVAVAATSQPDAVGTGVKVHYTGHATAERVKQLEEAFPQAASIERRDKLASINYGALFLVKSNIPHDQLFYDTRVSEAEREKWNEYIMNFIRFSPPKSLEMMERLKDSTLVHRQTGLPITLGHIGSNYISCKLSADATYEVNNVHSSGGDALLKSWTVIKPPTCTADDFSSFLQLAAIGERRNVDSLVTEVANAIGFYSTIVGDFPIFDFGKLEKLTRDQIAPEHLARATLGFQTDLIAMKAFDYCMLQKAYGLYFSGSLIQNDFVREEILLRAVYNIFPDIELPRFFKTDAIAALGACLSTA